MPVRFVGSVEASDFFEEIDVIVVPSLWEEPLSRAIFEAYAHGKPVLGSRRGGTPEIIDENVTGLLFSTDSPIELASIFRNLSHDKSLIESMSEHSLAKAKNFLPEQMAKQYEEVYRSVSIRPRLCLPIRGGSTT
jgi:glycosyltransferase involved in cell wall biosynthesis